VRPPLDRLAPYGDGLLRAPGVLEDIVQNDRADAVSGLIRSPQRGLGFLELSQPCELPADLRPCSVDTDVPTLRPSRCALASSGFTRAAYVFLSLSGPVSPAWPQAGNRWRRRTVPSCTGRSGTRWDTPPGTIPTQSYFPSVVATTAVDAWDSRGALVEEIENLAQDALDKHQHQTKREQLRPEAIRSTPRESAAFARGAGRRDFCIRGKR